MRSLLSNRTLMGEPPKAEPSRHVGPNRHERRAGIAVTRAATNGDELLADTAEAIKTAVCNAIDRTIESGEPQVLTCRNQTTADMLNRTVGAMMEKLGLPQTRIMVRVIGGGSANVAG